jgi:hypothetical protein
MSKSPPFLYKAILAATFSITACGTLSQPFSGPSRGPQAVVAPDAAPDSELSEEILYELLVGEIALQRGDPALASQIYLDLAKRTRDPRVARRAIEIANFARLPDAALDAAKIWQGIEPASPQALQIVAALLVAAKRVDEAEPYLEKLLAADGVNLEGGFLRSPRATMPAPSPRCARPRRCARNGKPRRFSRRRCSRSAPPRKRPPASAPSSRRIPPPARQD